MQHYCRQVPGQRRRVVPPTHIRATGPSPFYAVLYVDDILISGKTPGIVKRLGKAFSMAFSMDCFAMTDMGGASLNTGMIVTRTRKNSRNPYTDIKTMPLEHPGEVRDAGLKIVAHTRVRT